MLESMKKNIVLTGAAAVILGAAAWSSVICSSHNNDLQITYATFSSYTSEYTAESCSSEEMITKHTEESCNYTTEVFAGYTAESFCSATEVYIQNVSETAPPSIDSIIIYVSSSGKYHARSDCSGMKHYTEMSLDAATSAGYSPCGRCFDTVQETATETIMQENADISDITEYTVYVSSSGKYHTISDCSGMKHYTEMSLSEAIAAEYDGCKKCTSTLDR